MQSTRLESFSRVNPSMAPLVEELRSYLSWLQEHGESVVIPRVAAVRLHISEADALALLGLFREDRIVRARYDLVCSSTRTVVASYYSIDDIPDEIGCPLCGDSHHADTLKIELVFEIVHDRAANAAA
jgi:hypothetical protein